MRFFLSVLLFFSSSFFSNVVFALSVPEKPQSYVNDYASLLSVEARQKIDDILGVFEKETSNQIVVAIFPSLEGQVLEDFSIKLAEKWKMGTKENDNGILLLISKEDRAARIEVGYGLEGALPDALAGQIIRTEIVPSFRQGDFDTGVLNAVNAMIQATRGEYKPKGPAADPIQKYGPWLFLGLIFYMLLPVVCYLLVIAFCVVSFGLPGLFLSLILVILLEFFRKILLPAGSTFTRRGAGLPWGGGTFGGGGFGGGFGGGGGGSFGGGGASGRW